MNVIMHLHKNHEVTLSISSTNVQFSNNARLILSAEERYIFEFNLHAFLFYLFRSVTFIWASSEISFLRNILQIFVHSNILLQPLWTKDNIFVPSYYTFSLLHILKALKNLYIWHGITNIYLFIIKICHWNVSKLDGKCFGEYLKAIHSSVIHDYCENVLQSWNTISIVIDRYYLSFYSGTVCIFTKNITLYSICSVPSQ